MSLRAPLVFQALLLSALCGANATAAAPPTPDPFSLPAKLWEESERKAVYVGADLARVPEVEFENLSGGDYYWATHPSQYINKARFLNSRQTDGFIKALMRQRGDLAGLPFLLGDDCRMTRSQSMAFANASKSIRKAGSDALLSQTLQEAPTDARIAALIQIFGAKDKDERLGLVKYLSSARNERTTRDLACLALFDPNKKIRAAALVALSHRPARPSTDVFVKALRYPWPAVAERATDAIVKLRRTDLLPQLVAVLDETDPRMPRAERQFDRRIVVTNELVRINHHKSCLLCHPPASRSFADLDEHLRAEVPAPRKPLPSSIQYDSEESGSGIFVRAEVTYLRQDFSVMQPVRRSQAWPRMQRFDFVVRKRLVSDDEAKDLRERLTKKEEGELSPYHRAAVRALRELTGRDVEPKAAAWRKVLKISAK